VQQRREFLREGLVTYAFACRQTSVTRDALADAIDHATP
jgi:hypothetical protein